nr:ribonuclease H-like domain-containing protein [Tanacetum cinerariifolium]
MSNHEDETITTKNAPPKNIPQITTVTNIFAKFRYLKKEEYDIWAMKMQNFISSSDLLCWNIVLKGNSAKSMTTNNDGNLKIRPPITAEEHQQVQREEKARNILLSALPDEHMGDFYHMIDARDIWNAINARFGGNAESKKMQKSLLKQKFEEFKVSEEEGLDKGYDKMQKILTQMNTLKIKTDLEDINLKFLRGLPSSWSGIALILKTNGGLEYISFDDLYNKLKFLEIDTKGYSSSSPTLPNAAFDSSKSKCSVVDDVLYSFSANHEIDQQLVYKALDQMNKNGFEEYDLKHQMAMLSIKQTEESNTESRSLENFGMIARIKLESDADSEGEVVSADDVISAGVSVSAGDVAAVVVSTYSETEFLLMGLSTEAHKHAVKSLEKQIKCHQTNQLVYEEKIRVLSYKLEKQSNILEYRQKLIGQAAQEKQDLMTKLDNELANQAKWNNSDESQMVYGKMATDSSEIKTNDDNISYSHDSVLFDFSDRSSKLSTNDFQTCDSSQECSRPNRSDHDSNDSISSVSAPASASSDTIVIDCDRQEDFPSVCTSSIKNDVKSSKTLCNKFGSFNKESHFRKHKSVTSKSCYVCGSYLHLLKYCDFHEQTFTKRNAEGKGKLRRRPTGKPVNRNRPNPVSAGQRNTISAGPPYPVSAGQPNPVSAGQRNIVSAGPPYLVFAGQPYPVSAGQPNPVSAGQPNPVSAGQQNTVSAGPPNPVYAGQPNPVSAGDGLLGPQPLNIQPTSTYFHSFTHNNQQIILPITHNSLYSLYMTGGLNGKTAVKPSVGWPWTKSSISTTKGSKSNGGSKSKSWSSAKGNKDKLEDFEHFDGGEVTFGGSIVPTVDEATIQHDGTKFDHAPTNKDNLDEITELQSLQRQEQEGKEEVDHLGLAFPSLNPILGVGSASIGTKYSSSRNRTPAEMKNWQQEQNTLAAGMTIPNNPPLN